MDEIIKNITTGNVSVQNVPTESVQVQNIPVQNVSQEPIKEPSKLKKGLKVFLVIFAFIWAISGVRAGLTKAGIIPNWFDVEFLCPGTSVNIDFGISDSGDYDRRDPDCSKKCHKECEKHEDEPFGYLCGNDCISRCQTPKRNNCLDSCEMPDIGEELKFYYAEEDYRHWCKEKYSGIGDCYSWGGYDSLASNTHYEEWIDEMFDGHQEELKAYESCRQACGTNPGEMMLMKPIIYFYPTVETEINVKLGTPKNLLHTYPKYNSEKGWNIVAQPNGDLEDMDTGRKLYALYREGKSDNETNFDEGFVVAGKDIISFLEEKLAILGLNEREAEEFIIYRLPQMEGNEWNLIRFETKEEQDENMLLNITPTPDTVVRVMMDWKAIDEPINIPEQKLTTPERNGFTVVEWGGSLKN